jgi:hypothetical protein
LPSNAWAQDRVAVNGPWTAQCRVDRVAGKTCEVQAVHDVRKPPLANYWLSYTLNDKVFAVVGAPCPAAGRLWIDRHPGAEVESCGRCACRMRAEDSARLFELARAGKSLFLEIKDSKGAAFGPYETRLARLREGLPGRRRQRHRTLAWSRQLPIGERVLSGSPQRPAFVR